MHVPYPEDRGGDVRKLTVQPRRPMAPAVTDSIWIDLDAPIMTAPRHGYFASHTIVRTQESEAMTVVRSRVPASLNQTQYRTWTRPRIT